MTGSRHEVEVVQSRKWERKEITIGFVGFPCCMGDGKNGAVVGLAKQGLRMSAG